MMVAAPSASKDDSTSSSATPAPAADLNHSPNRISNKLHLQQHRTSLSGNDYNLMHFSFGHSSFSSAGTDIDTSNRATNISIAGGPPSLQERRTHSLTRGHHVPSRVYPLFDPMRVVTHHQLQAMELLDTTPMWVFDFIQRKNIWANVAGLKLWNAPSLQEFVDRDMTDMSETAVVTTQKCQDRISQGQKVQEQWTFYPKGKAKTVAVTITGMRLSENDDHASMFITGTIIKMPTSKRNRLSLTTSKVSETTSGTASCCSSRSCGTSNEEEDLKTLHEEDEGVCDLKESEHGSLALHDSVQSLKLKEAVVPLQDSNLSETYVETIKDSCDHHDKDHNSDDDENCDDDGDDDAFLRSNPLYQENFRVAAILRYLPTAVCMFDMDGRALYQNPASYLPEQQGHHDNRLGSRNHVGESKETKPEEFMGHDVSESDSDEAAEGVPLSFGHKNGFLRRFVDPMVASEALGKLKGSSSFFASLNIEAELYTNEYGKTQWSAIQLRKTLDPVSGDPVFLFSSLDRSDALEAQKERKARIEESEFLAIMAHEIRTPLHQVTGFIDLLECSSEEKMSEDAEPVSKEKEAIIMNDTMPSNLTKEQQGYVKLLRSSATQLMTVINDVLDYSKLEAGQMKIESIPFEPLSVVKGSIAATQGSCDEKGLNLTMEYGESQYDVGTGSPFASRKGYSIIPFRILGDPNRLRQVLLNLLSNAIKFTSKGGIHVQVSSFITEDHVRKSDMRRWIRFVVTDTGTGIAESKLTTVFQKYQQANASDARMFGGTGLGLTICQSLIQKMGGTIGVDSQLGEGSSFWFSLPIVLPIVTRDTIDRKSEGEEDDAPITAMNILVAEDNKVNQKLVANMLKRMGHHAVMVEDGQQAIAKLKETQDCAHILADCSCCRPTYHSFFDVVLMDIQMPIMDGLEATRRIRHMGYTHLPILGLTASQKRSDFEELGFDDWMPKPIPMKALNTKLRRLHERSKGRNKEGRKAG